MAARWWAAVLGALIRARWGIVTIAVTYAATVLTGIVMAHGGNAFALERRGSVVASAQAGATLDARRQGQHVRAALLDFRDNLVFGATIDTLSGATVAGPYALAAYRGWVGGIVSVDGEHRSRLAAPRPAAYYVVALVLQLIPYTLAGGSGVACGVESWRTRRDPAVKRWLTLPQAAVLDVVRVYALVVPLFLVAALFEFLA
jgi:hypothetical protein